MSARSEPRLPFEEEEEVRLKPDQTGTVRLKADTTGVNSVRLEANAGDVRLQPDPAGGVGLQPDLAGGVRLQPDLADKHARRAAVDPAQNVVLEASAGTGKTQVLVERYVNLLRAGVEPDHILAITFTRKAAAEMRQRIIDRLKEASRLSEFDAGRPSTSSGRPELVEGRWRELRERLGDIAISTIDAFCLSLLREFPLEADVDPGFDLAADTDIPRLIADSLDQALRICRAAARDDEDVALVFAQLGERRLRAGIGALLDRRLVAPHALRRFLQKGPRDLTGATACEMAGARLRDIFTGVRDGLDRFLDDGPIQQPQFAMLAADIRALVGGPERPALRPDGTETNGVARPFPAFAGDQNEPASARLAEAPEARRRQGREEQAAAFRALIDRLRAYFLTQDGKPRGEKFSGTAFKTSDCHTEDAWRRHRASAAQIAPLVADAIRAFRRDLNVVMSRGVWRIFAVALTQYQRTLDAHALLDFSGVLERAVRLLKDLDEFAESRLRLEARYRHVLVDEFQDTSRAQWELVRQLVKSWGEGFGAADAALPPSIFIVGDRKQSIYGFRDADVALVDEAAQFIEGLRPDGRPRQAISVSFRSAPQILAFVNDLFAQIVAESPAENRKDAFRYAEQDRFPVDDEQVRLKADTTEAVRLKADTTETVRLKADATNIGAVDIGGGVDIGGVRLQPPFDASQGGPEALEGPDLPLALIAADTVQAAADRVADEIVRLLSGTTVRDRTTGVAREARPADIAVLFRSRDSHRNFESALDRRDVPTYVYKGLGFFDADEVQDAVALLRYLADPLSNLRAATFLRSRLVRLSDDAIVRLAPDLVAAILEKGAVPLFLGDEDRRVLELLRRAVPRWLSWVDRLTPSELLDAVLRETAYAYELRGTRRRQARENLKKLRAMIRRAQNRGYATLARMADHLERLAVGDESNAAIDAIDAVSLMTVHAAKGLEFPIVFVVNMGRGTATVRAPIRIANDAAGAPSVAIADYQSEADEDAQAREREESKRLLYVALTRARDRLYLSATVQNGQCRMTRGSLGEVLPASVKALFVEAASEAETPVTWSGHSLLVPARAVEPGRYARTAITAEVVDDFAPLVDGPLVVRPR